MATPPRPLGQRFSHVYIERGLPPRIVRCVRRRIAAMIANNPDLTELSPLLPRELGVDVVWAGYGTNWPDTLARLAVRDFLDLITLAFLLAFTKKTNRA